MSAEEQEPFGMERRQFIKLTTAAAGGLAVGGCSSLSRESTAQRSAPTLSVSQLPNGAAPAALAFPHFPDRMHAFVWRNWPLVPAERMAKVVGARTADIERMAHGMGLGQQPRITPDQQARSYLTIIKRNWHLLPYEQLLGLLGWTVDELAYTLREDDFLFVKLGNLKPRCESLRYAPPDAATLAREAEIASILRRELPDSDTHAGEPLFAFVDQLSHAPAASTPKMSAEPLRFCYSYFALYGDPLLEERLAPYPDGYLARLAEAGVNGVWLQAVLYRLAKFPWEPAQSAKYEQRLTNLRRLTERAAKRGIRIFLYLNEPRAMPLCFFEDRPNLKGVIEGDHAALCTSVPEVQAYLTNSVAAICRAAPALGGFFTISASENFTNCWSHGGGSRCPRCGKRAPAEVIAEVNALMWEGIRQAGFSARFIAWDWGWNDAWAPEAISRLPREITVMSVSEWRLPITRGGIKTEVGEYSLSAVGPGPRAPSHWRAAKESGHRIAAKIQAANTWELSAVPYIPAVENTAHHVENLGRLGVSDVMLGWTLGGYPSPNLEVVGEVLKGASAAQALMTVAERRYGRVLAPAVVEAWHEFSLAFQEFPFHVGTVYSGPQQLGPANLLWAEPTKYAATMVGFPYDDLDGWRAVYPADVFAEQLEKVAKGFGAAFAKLAKEPGLAGASDGQRAAFDDLCRVAEATEIHYQSAANQAKFILARREASASKGRVPPELIARVAGLLEGEIALARRLFALQRRDSRLGFEASNHYFYVPADLAEKVVNCRYLLEQWVATLRRRGE